MNPVSLAIKKCIATVSISAACLLYSPVDLHSESIVFKIIIAPSSGSEGVISMKTMTQAWFDAFSVPSSGIKDATVNCAVGTFFKARIDSGDYTLLDGSSEQQGCVSGDIPFYFRGKKYLKILREVRSGKLLENIPSAEAEQWQSELVDAIKQGNTEIALKRSSQIQEFLYKNKYFEQAEKYGVLHYDIASPKLGGQTELQLDPVQKKFVLSTKDIEAIKVIQLRANLKVDGQLNWPTMAYVGKN